ncbi:serine hydrolase [Rhizobium mongolense]|uniref:serine hydrolase n=1 Tax=Rhizobium mongolense TaxID=57676 RepID=UPI002D795414|nr:serine hydrolase [Rhizobium mongolense]
MLYEHYQYGPTNHDRFLSQSMAKTITAMLIGIAISEGAIHSVDDTVQTYVPELTGKEIGKTPIQAFLHMASGIAFTQSSQGADDRTSDDARLDRELFGKDKISTIDQSSALRSDARLTPSFLR